MADSTGPAARSRMPTPDPPPLSVLELVAEMRQIALVAGQCSVEGPDDAKSLMAAAEAERATRWADALEALGRRAVPQAQGEPPNALRHEVAQLDRAPRPEEVVGSNPTLVAPTRDRCSACGWPNRQDASRCEDCNYPLTAETRAQDGLPPAPVDPLAAPSSVQALKRYDLREVSYNYWETDHEMEPSPDGDWVKYEDVAALVGHEPAPSRPDPEKAHELCVEAVKAHPNGMIPVQSVYDMLLKMVGREDIIDAMQRDWEALQHEAVGHEPAPQAQGESSERTLRSLAAMLGWGNVPPRHIFELEINALKAMAKAEPEAGTRPAPPECEGECNPYEAKCGALFCSYEAMLEHQSSCSKPLPPAPERPQESK